MLPVPEELRLLEAVVAAWSRRLVWPWPEAEVRVTVTLVGGGLGDRRSLKERQEEIEMTDKDRGSVTRLMS